MGFDGREIQYAFKVSMLRTSWACVFLKTDQQLSDSGFVCQKFPYSPGKGIKTVGFPEKA